MRRVKTLLAGETPRTWLFYGDSITHGVAHTHGWRDYTELFAERVRYEMGRALDIVLNTAVSGNTTIDLLDSFEWRVARFHPDVIFLMIGMNDSSDTRPEIDRATFTANLETICEKAESLGCLPVLQTTSLVLPGASPDREAHLPGFMDAVRAVARHRELPLVDHTAHWEDHGEQRYLWNSNAFHPNEMGHRALARCLFDAMGIQDPASLTCRLYLP